jgi:hypothetical protein
MSIEATAHYPARLDLPRLAPGLKLGQDGIWFAQHGGAISYPAHGNAACRQIEDRSFWFKHRSRCIVALVRRFAPDEPLLDIGGGNGFVAHALQAAGIPPVLLEPGLEGAVAARRRGIEQVVCARLEDVDFRPGAIASIGLFDVLEHIEDDLAALHRVRALMRDGSRLFLTVPAFNLLHSADDVAAGHFRRYTRAGLLRLLRQAGFAPEFATYLFAPLPLPLFLLRSVPSWLGLRRGLDERQAAEHVPQGLVARMIEAVLAAEASRIESGRTVPFGTSCCAVAAAS